MWILIEIQMFIRKCFLKSLRPSDTYRPSAQHTNIASYNGLSPVRHMLAQKWCKCYAALLPLCEGKPPMADNFPHKWPVMQKLSACHEIVKKHWSPVVSTSRATSMNFNLDLSIIDGWSSGVSSCITYHNTIKIKYSLLSQKCVQYSIETDYVRLTSKHLFDILL